MHARAASPLVVAVLALAFAGTARGAACTDSWTNVAGGSWESAGNWDNGVPGHSDVACITLAGNYTVTVPGGETVSSLALGSASGATTQKLLIEGPSTSQVSFAGDSSIGKTGEIDLETAVGGGPAGVVGSGGATLTNDGVLRVQDDGSNTDFVEADLTNAADGKVEVAAGELDQDVGTTTTNDGSVTVDGGASLKVISGSGSFVNNSTVTDDGTIALRTAAWTQNGSVSGNTVTLDGGTLTDTSGAGSFALGTASVQVSGTIPAGQTVTVFGDGAELTGGPVINDGTLVLDDQALSDRAVSLTGDALTNNGTLRSQVEGTKTIALDVDVTNSSTGKVEVESGELDQLNTFTLSNHGNLVLDPAGIFDVAGTVTNQTDGTMTFGIAGSADFGTLATTGSGAFDLAGGTAAPVLVGGYEPTAMQEFDVIAATHGTETFDTVLHDFAGDYADPAVIGLVYQGQGTTTSLASSANPSTFGQSVTFTATITPAAGSTGDPTGTVTFSDGADVLGTGSVSTSAGLTTATFTTSSLSTGTHASITASYGGDANFESSISSPLSQEVDQATTTASVSASAPSVAYGDPVTFTATVAGPAGASPQPSGTVTFAEGPTTLGTGSLSVVDGNDVATLQTSSLAVGSHTIDVTYGGDANYVGAGSSSGAAVTITRGETTTIVSTSANPSTAGQSVTFTATVSPASGSDPTGTVTFFDGADTLGTGPVSTSAGVSTATFTTSTLSLGVHSITATYGGDGNFQASPASSALSQDTQTTPTVSIARSASSADYGQAVTFTATVAPPAGFTQHPSGTVRFDDGGAGLGSASVSDVGGADVATLASSTLSAGSHTITATYEGDSDYTTAGSAGGASVTIDQAATSVAVTSSANPSTAGQAVTFTAAITPASGRDPTGTVTFSESGGTLGTAPTSGSAATYTTSSLAVGAHSITATYGGDANFEASPASSAISQTVDSGGPAITRQPGDATVTVGQTATFTAAASGVPTPTVQWEYSTDGGSTWSRAADATSGTLTIPDAGVTESREKYRAQFTNSAGSATSDAATLTVNLPAAAVQPGQTSITTPAIPCPPGGSCPASATAQTVLNFPLPTVVECGAAPAAATRGRGTAPTPPVIVRNVPVAPALMIVEDALSAPSTSPPIPPVSWFRQPGPLEVTTPVLCSTTPLSLGSTRASLSSAPKVSVVRARIRAVLASIGARHPTAADIKAFDEDLTLAASPSYSQARSLARLTLVAAVDKGRTEIAHQLGYKHVSRLRTAKIVLGSARARLRPGTKKALRIRTSVLGGRILRLLTVAGLAGNVTIQVQVSETTKGKTHRSNRTITVL